MKAIKFSLVIILLSITSSFAQNYNDALRLGLPGLGSNARALGMGNSFISISDDASAAFFNPAGFGLMKKMEFSGGLDFHHSITMLLYSIILLMIIQTARIWTG